jgi:lysozyme
MGEMENKTSLTQFDFGREFARSTRTMLMQDEGLRYSPYKDTENNWTIGVGHYIGERLENLKLSWGAIVQLLQDDIDKHIDELYFVFGREAYQSFATGRQLALLNMMFNLGRDRFAKFGKLIAAVKANDWEAAAREALDSKWARQVDPKLQVGAGRDDRVAQMLLTGKIHPHYEV